MINTNNQKQFGRRKGLFHITTARMIIIEEHHWKELERDYAGMPLKGVLYN